MQIRIKSTEFEMTTEVQVYLEQKIAAIEKLLAHNARMARCEVELGRAVGHSQQGDVWRAEIIVLHEGMRHVAEATGESVNAAIDVAKDEILQQLRKNKDRSTTLMRRLGNRLKKFARRGDMRSY